MRQRRNNDAELSRSTERALNGVTTVGCIVLAVGTIVGLALVGFKWWASFETPTVNFILPANFDGPFVIVSCANQRATAPAKAEYSFHIPSNGVLVVDDDSVLRKWHTTVVSMADGTFVRVPPDMASDRVGRDRVFLSKGAAYSGNCREHWFVFGVLGNANDIQKTPQLEDALKDIRAN